MKEPFGGLILNVAFRMLVPFTITYGIYVLCLGEFSPGGGFQAGALLSVGVLLARLILGFDTKFNVLGKTSVVLAGVGTFLYAFTGWLTLFGGADFFLNYNYMPIHMEPQHEMHAMGIFLIEIGVAICVMMTIINLLDAIVKRGDEDGSSQLVFENKRHLFPGHDSFLPGCVWHGPQQKLYEEADGDERYAGCRNLFLSVFCTEGWRNDSYPERPDNRS